MDKHIYDLPLTLHVSFRPVYRSHPGKYLLKRFVEPGIHYLVFSFFHYSDSTYVAIHLECA